MCSFIAEIRKLGRLPNDNNIEQLHTITVNIICKSSSLVGAKLTYCRFVF